MTKILELDLDEQPGEVAGFRVNEAYAKKFEHGKQRDELMKLRDKYGNVTTAQEESASDSESDETEDEIGEEVTPAIDVQILKTIAAIRNHDEACYDPTKHFFQDSELNELDEDARKKNLILGGESKKAAEKPVFLRDYQLNAILEGDQGAINSNTPAVPTHQQEQDNIKREFISAAETQVNAAEEGDDDLFTVTRDKSIEEKDNDASYSQWVIDNLKQDDKSKKAFESWINPDKPAPGGDDEKFLADFILNRGWIDGQRDVKLLEAGDEINEDDEFLDKAENFEREYNFRYEQIELTQGPGASYQPSNMYGLTSHAREIPESVRRKDDSRAQKRKERQERKEKEKQKKSEEIKRLKNLKKKEMKELASKVQKWSGMDDQKAGDRIASLMEKMDDDQEFDSENWDNVMDQMFDADYYQEAENEKPVFSDDDTKYDAENLDEYEFNGGSDDDEAAIDAESVPAVPEPAPEKLAELERLQEEYNNLDHEDIVAGIPTRFKYRAVEKDDFGLTAEEILVADDTILNKYMPLKKLAPFRNRPMDVGWMQNWKKGSKKRRREFRKELTAAQEAAQKEAEEAAKGEVPVESSKKDKKRKRKDTEEAVPKDDIPPKKEGSEKKRSRTKKTKVSLDQDRMASYGIST